MKRLRTMQNRCHLRTCSLGISGYAVMSCRGRPSPIGFAGTLRGIGAEEMSKRAVISATWKILPGEATRGMLAVGVADVPISSSSHGIMLIISGKLLEPAVQASRPHAGGELRATSAPTFGGVATVRIVKVSFMKARFLNRLRKGLHDEE